MNAAEFLASRSVGGKLLRRGYTTGSCAAGAAKAAAMRLLSKEQPERVALKTPSGEELRLEVLAGSAQGESCSCAIRKEAGDDPDVTDGLLIFASVEKIPGGFEIRGGEGVGRVTRPGLDQPPGEAAINSVPRRMILENVRAVCAEYGYTGGLRITIRVPGGEEVAKRTFNPRLGIEGGISIIGTSGIVEPMSSRAIAETVRLELRQLAQRGEKRLLLTPGNYGEAFARETLSLPMKLHISCSNYIGESLDMAVETGFRQILLVGHIGKLVKLGIGLMNTHSSFGDGRLETLAACALEAGGRSALLREVLACATTDAALEILESARLLGAAMERLKERVTQRLEARMPRETRIACVCFTKAKGPKILFESDNAKEMMDRWKEEEKFTS